MFFLKLITFILTSIPLHDVTIVGARVLTSRDLLNFPSLYVPKCPQQPGFEKPPAQSLSQRRQQELAADVNAKKGRGWRPSLCTKLFWICVYIQKNVTYDSAGIPGAGSVDQTFKLDDNTTVQAIWYWQGTLQYVAPGGTVNIYPAHGNHWLCVEGGMKIQTLGASPQTYVGDLSHPTKLGCRCYWQPNTQRSSDDDLIIYAKQT
ncbi:hypothetical protein CROQUDRAFT_653714 [Cronartium quercuum f. sp. fusiforme G11]|uniref:Uncharacterized protein n=1 Tax=Cronartium quercuum f. sp. fusiforme G11 TaxID=708437 RepID=A0A9P6TEI6_9BASI|nr:hypothetical protein CROQUDRAFT_653714 [Cronartium quercuum f. sp. fusiforme G11]